MAKKENPNLVFRKEWWDSLRHKSPELFKESLSILFSTYFDGKHFDPYAFDEQGSNPTPAQDLAIPMIKVANLEKEAYIAKCERNAANVRKKYENVQSFTTVNDRKQQSTMVGNTIQYNTIQDNTIQENSSSLSACTCAHEKTAEEEEEREELLLSLTFFFLSNGVLNPYTTAQQAVQHNESMNWKVTTSKGIIYDHSHDKLSFLKGWRCEKNCYNLNDASLFVSFCKSTGLHDTAILDDYRGIVYGQNLTFLFQHSKTVKHFVEIFKSDKELLNKAFSSVKQLYPEAQGFKATLYKQE